MKKTASDLIRAAVEEHYVRRPTSAEYRSVLDQSFGSWKGRKKSSLVMIRKLRHGKRLKRLVD